MDKLLIPSPHPQVAATVVDGQAVIVMADSGQVTVLNEVGTRIWELIDGEHSLEQIIQAIMAEYEVTPEVAQQDTENFVNRLVEIQAIVWVDPSAPG
jgi:hypothetical protein